MTDTELVLDVTSLPNAVGWNRAAASALSRPWLRYGEKTRGVSGLCPHQGPPPGREMVCPRLAQESLPWGSLLYPCSSGYAQLQSREGVGAGPEESQEGYGLYSRQQARNSSRSLGTASFRETLSLAPMKSTPPRCRGIGVWAVGVLAVTLPCTTRRMLAESTAKTLYSATEPGTWAERTGRCGWWSLPGSSQRAPGQPQGQQGEELFSPAAQALVSVQALSGPWYKGNGQGP